jgi:hypothetical protein
MSAKETEPTATAQTSDSDSSSSSRPERGRERTDTKLDLIFGILKNRRRRLVLAYIQDKDHEVTLSDVAEHIAAIENDTTVAQLTSSERKRVYVGLYQCHLPKMDDAGAIDYNQSRGLIQRTDQTDQFEMYLEQGSEAPDRRWYRYYGAIATLGVIPILLGSALSLAPLLLGGLYSVVLAAVGAVAVYHRQVRNGSRSDDAPSV